MSDVKRCIVPSCDRDHSCRGMCHKHYWTWNKCHRPKGTTIAEYVNYVEKRDALRKELNEEYHHDS